MSNGVCFYVKKKVLDWPAQLSRNSIRITDIPFGISDINISQLLMAKKEQSRRTQKKASLFFPFLFTKRLLGAWSQQYFTITKKGRQQMQINKAAELHRSKVGQNENRW
jgi:hypothetical protein